ncbi:MAG: hypothetical protein JOY80_11255 [Candidatus Dormibacteraeota bacterium]|nr:hypothetical protein [Candidatus Dormibacteraeota bacterium]
MSKRWPLGTIAVVVVCAAGCSSATSATPGAANGGTVTVGVWQSPLSLLDAGIAGESEFAAVMDAPVQEGLLWYRPDQATQHATGPADYWAPDLATEVPTIANGDVKTSGCAVPKAAMCVTWKLRSGVEWDDGTTFTSHDVCDTVKLRWLTYGATGKTSPTNLASTAGWDQVIDCTEKDRSTAVISFASVYGPYLTVGSGVYGVLPASIIDRALSSNSDLQKLSVSLDLRKGSQNAQAFHGSGTLDALLDGTGPYVLQSYQPGKQLTLTQNKNYWNRAQAPHLDTIEFVTEGDLSTEVTNVLSGAVNVGYDLRLANLPAVVKASGGGNPVLRVDTVAEPGVEKIDLNLCAGDGGLCDNPAADQSMYTADTTVRRAMLMAIDRTAIIKAVAAGRTTVPRDSWMYLGASYLASQSIPQTGFSRSSANAMLDQAGFNRDAKCGSAPGGQPYRVWKDGSCLVVNLGTTSDDPVRVKVAGMVQTDLAAVGIRVPSPLTPNMASASFFAPFAGGGPLYTHAYDTALFAFALTVPGEPSGFASLYHADCGGSCPQENQVPSSGNGGQGMNDTGLDDSMLDSALDKGAASVDPAVRTGSYVVAEQRLAATLPELPLFQQLAVNTYSTQLQGVQNNAFLWDFDTAAWSCTGGNCQP